jgi:hypothetical protein
VSLSVVFISGERIVCIRKAARTARGLNQKGFEQRDLQEANLQPISLLNLTPESPSEAQPDGPHFDL